MKRNGSTYHVPERPAPGRRPVKVDIFDLVTKNLGTLQLVPIFPYLHDGAVVPCLSSAAGYAELPPFHFFHKNELTETVLCLAEHGGAMKPGLLMKVLNVHGVTSFLRNARDPENFNVMLITIRMKSGADQQEGIILRCGKCNAIVFERDFNVKEGPERKHYPEFYALRYYGESFREFNQSVEKRTCPKCGTVQPEVPADEMGYYRYMRNMEVANRGREQLESMAGRATAKPSRMQTSEAGK